MRKIIQAERELSKGKRSPCCGRDCQQLAGLSKRSQVTAFVILGLIILIIAGLALFLKSYLADKGTTPITVDKELEPFRQAVEECLYNSGKDALIKIGMQGGYLKKEPYLSPTLNNPTRGNAFYFSPGGDPTKAIVIPYWSYLVSDEIPYAFSSARPSIYPRSRPASIEGQMDAYVKEHSEECIQEMKELFTDRGFDFIEDNEGTYQTIISETNVVIELDRPMKVTLAEKTLSINLFRANMHLNLKKIYDTASRLLVTVGNEEARFFEKSTIEYIAPFALSPESELPPIAQTLESSLKGDHMWNIYDVKARIKEILADNVNNIQVQGTRNNIMPLILFDPIKEAVYDKYYFSLSRPDDSFDVSDYRIAFTYLPWWEPAITVRPSKGALIRPESVKTTFPFPVAYQKYIFFYDISYPILIQINDPDAFLGEGYTFQFGYEVNIRDTQPIGADYELIDIPEQTNSLFCEPSQRTSGTITITAKDIASRQTIPDARIWYACTQESCEMGNTGNDGKLLTGLPLCMDGRIIPESPGMFGHASLLSTQAGRADTTDVYLEAYKNVTLHVKEMFVGKMPFPEHPEITYWTPLPGRGFFDLTFDEWALVTFTRIQEPGEQEYSQVVKFLWNETAPNVLLVSGSYKIEAQIFKDLGPGKIVEEIRFPEKTYGGGLFGGEETTAGPLVFNEIFVLGSLVIDENYPFNMTLAEMTDNLTLIVPALVTGTPPPGVRGIDDFEDVKALEMTNLEITGSLDEAFLDTVMPRFGGNG